jgi:peptidoglycan/LPS O-acetylase OafA/YrhL
VGLKYEPSLDGLRSVAVLAVIAYHARAPFMPAGGRGVDVFFVLSGFLITSILAERSTGLIDFWRKRAIRLVPALLPMILVTLLIAPRFMPQYAATVWRDALFTITYTMNLAEAAKPWDNPFMHTWSLAAEAQFYLVWPFVLPVILRRQNAGLWLLALWIGMTGLQAVLGATAPFESYYFPHFGGLLLGAAVAFLPVANRWLGIVGFGMVVLALTNSAQPEVIAEVGAALIISACRAPCALRSLLEWPPLVKLGLISYGVYLWHFPIHCAVEHTVWWFRGAVALWGGIVMGSLSYVAVERPVSRWLRPAAASAGPLAA